jgi:spore coat polysaccharide biosynthesis predicted glycosyltransferase SpsG
MSCSGAPHSGIAFVVRASASDGLGHLVRTLCVIQEIGAIARPHLFLLGDISGHHLIEEVGVQWTYSATDAECAAEVIEYRPRSIVFDTLHFSAEAFETFPSDIQKISLSPVFSCMQEIDHLFHRTKYEPASWGELEKFPYVHKGLKYTILPSWLKRVSHKNYHDQLVERRLAIAISMGGTDALNRTLELLKLFNQKKEKLVIWVAIGEAYAHSYEQLLSCAADNRQEVILVKSNESMWRVLKNASLVICAGGLTTYEAAYIGIPSINILQNANWSYLFDEIAESNVCYVIKPSGDDVKLAVDLTISLVKNRNKLHEMHKATRGLIPSGGARNVARRIASLSKVT